MALLFGSSLGGRGSAVSNLDSFVHFAVHLVDELVSVHRKATRHLHIICRHGGRYFTPAAESVALLFGSSLGSGGSAVSNLDSFVHLTVHLVDELVSVHRKLTRHLHIICRHCGGYFAPAAESVAFFGESLFGSDGSAISNLCGLVHLAVHLVDEFVSVRCKATRHLHIVCWHGERQSCPPAERVTLAFGVCDGSECCAVWHLLSIVFRATDFVCQRVAACSVEHQRTAGSAAQTLRLEGDVAALGLQVEHLARVGVAQAQNDVLALRLIAAHAQVEPLRLVLGLHLGRAAAFVAHKGPHLVVAEVGYRRAVKHDVGVERHVVFVVVRIDRPWRLAAAVLGACAEHAQQQCGYEQPQAFRVYMCHVCVCIYYWLTGDWLTGLQVNGFTGSFVCLLAR